MSTLPFDVRNIAWQTLEDLPGVAFFVCAVDEDKRVVDILFKFEAGARTPLHRHKSDYVTFVVQGELRIYRPSGELKEIRPVGSYVAGKANGEPHTEGSGADQDVIAFFSNRGVDELIYELLDENLATVDVLGMTQFRALMEAQAPQPSTLVA